MYDNWKEIHDWYTVRYINIIANNDVWVLNRISNLIRKRNYNIDDMNLTFDNKWRAHFLMWFYSRLVDINQIIDQLSKLYDVVSIEKIEDLRRIKKTYYVYSKDKSIFDTFSVKPIIIEEIPDVNVWIYILDFDSNWDFVEELNKSWLKYLRKCI